MFHHLLKKKKHYQFTFEIKLNTCRVTMQLKQLKLGVP